MLETYLKSWNGFAGQDRQALANHWGSGDFVSRFGGLVTAFRTTPTALWHYFASNVTTKIDNESAILTLRVVGYDPQFVKQLADSVILSSGRTLNLINQQAYKTTEGFFAGQIVKDRAMLRSDIDQLSAFQRTNKIVDPAAAYNAQLELLNQYKSKLAALTAQAKVVQATTPNSAEVQNLAIQSQAAELEIKQVQKAVSDGPGALTQVSGEFAFLQSAIKNDDAALAADQELLLRAQQTGSQNQYYFQFVSAPTTPVDSTEPSSAILIASILAATFFLYVIIK